MKNAIELRPVRSVVFSIDDFAAKSFLKTSDIETVKQLDGLEQWINLTFDSSA